jgi:hypothetical protein
LAQSTVSQAARDRDLLLLNFRRLARQHYTVFPAMFLRWYGNRLAACFPVRGRGRGGKYFPPLLYCCHNYVGRVANGRKNNLRSRTKMYIFCRILEIQYKVHNSTLSIQMNYAFCPNKCSRLHSLMDVDNTFYICDRKLSQLANFLFVNLPIYCDSLRLELSEKLQNSLQSRK